MATILVVDNDPETVGLTRAAMALAGHEVLTTLDQSKIITLAKAAHVSAVVLEVLLPDFSGFDVLRALRKDPDTAKMPVLITSVLGSGGDRVRGLYEGADDYLTKPFVPLELVLRTQRLIARAEADTAQDQSESIRRSLARIEHLRAEGKPLTEVVLGRYQVTDILGEGAMGTVFRGFDPRLKRSVALKTIRLVEHVVEGDPSERVHRLLLEAMMVAQISSPNIVAVYDVGHARDAGYIVMELVDGPSLETLLARVGKLTAAQAVPLAAAMFRGLAAAHDHRLVHHDVKPGNVLLGRSATVKLTDFGVAELLSGWVKDSEKVFGTPGYLPPEAIRGDGYDQRGDIFAAGVVLYQCLTGERAFASDTVEGTLLKTVREPLPATSKTNDTVPEELDALVAELTAKHKSARTRTATLAAERLEKLASRNEWRWDASILDIPGRPEVAEQEALRARPVPTARVDPAP